MLLIKLGVLTLTWRLSNLSIDLPLPSYDFIKKFPTDSIEGGVLIYLIKKSKFDDKGTVFKFVIVINPRSAPFGALYEQEIVARVFFIFIIIYFYMINWK